MDCYSHREFQSINTDLNTELTLTTYDSRNTERVTSTKKRGRQGTQSANKSKDSRKSSLSKFREKIA